MAPPPRAWPPASRAAAVVGLSVAAHALTLLGLTAGSEAPSQPIPSVGPGPVSVRVLEPVPVRPAAAPALSAAEPAPTPEAVPAPDPVPRTIAAPPVGTTPAPGPAAPAVDRARPNSPPDAVVAAASPPRPAPQPPVQASARPSLPPAPDHHVAATLDPGPRPLADIDFVYPPEAGLHDGVVVVRLLIDERGTITDIGIVRSQPDGMFDAAAIRAFAAASFSPGRLGGVPVKSQLTAEVEFKPYNRGANVSGRGY